MKRVSINFFCFKKDAKKRHVGHVEEQIQFVGAFVMGSSDSSAKIVVFTLPGLTKEFHPPTDLSGFGIGFFISRPWRSFLLRVGIPCEH